MSDEPLTQTHIIGVEVLLDNRQRQRCAWCGAVLLDNDLSRMAAKIELPDGVEVSDEAPPARPAAFPVGKLLRITGAEGESRVFESVDPGEGGNLPDDACTRVHDDVTV